MTITAIETEFRKIVKKLAVKHKLGGHVLVAHDRHAVNALSDKTLAQLVVVMPSTSMSGRPDSFTLHKTILLFILEKSPADATAEKELGQYQRTEDIMNDLLDYIQESQSEGCSFWNNYDPSSVTVDPEYREFGGWNGWSLSMSF